MSLPDPALLQRVVQPALDEVQHEIDGKITEALEQVRDDLSGREPEVVYADLRSRLLETVPALNIHEAHLRQVAQLISRRRL
ncbi:hypothetical protein NOCA2300014 [metagenome]|uniref:Uncharacterized protein n=1 Tax=metagenome TaxID=256318 RepID=A0A2P2C4Y0_9ZZZZ